MDPKQLGPFIAARRKELGMTQAELAQKLYVTDKAVSRWERGVGLPDVNSLQPLSEALELTLVELMQARRKEAETITTHEVESLLRETIVLSGNSRKKQIAGGVLLCGFGLAALLLLVLLAVTGKEVLLPVGSLVSGLAAWGIPVGMLTLGKRRNAAGAVTASAGFGFLAVLFQFFDIARRAEAGDWSGIGDTIGALIRVAAFFSMVTLALNGLLVLTEARKKDK